jgi:glycosyltransferase involved in cell wall biosynthesis
MEKNSNTFAMKVGFFLPSYNNLEELKLAINSINSIDAPIVVGVDGSTDGTKEWLQYNQIQFFEHPEGRNLGRAATRNLALQLDWDWVIFMDSDLEFCGKIDSFLINPSTVEINVGTINYKQKDSNKWIHYCSGRGAHKFADGVISYGSFTTGICGIPMNIFRQLNGFDGQFTTYGGEDLEFALRAKNHHIPIIKTSSLMANSNDNKSLEMALNQMERFGETGIKIIQKKHPEIDPYQLKKKITTKFEWLARLIIPLIPIAFQSKMIHYLVYCAVKKGYYSKRT